MDSESLCFDFAVIGGGSAGYAAARTAVAAGLKTVVIDGAKTLGGLCILRGCMPSKALIESASRAISIRRATEFGLKASWQGAQVRAIRDRKRSLIADFAGYRQGQLESGKFTLMRGGARFVSPTDVEVTGMDGSLQKIEFASACIATGSEISIIPAEGLRETGFWTSDDILDAEELPQSFIVLGGGAIALEMAHYLEGIGRQVALVQRSKGVLTTMDPECGEAVTRAFRKRGMQVHCGTRIEKVEKIGELKRVTFTTEQGTETVEAEEILVAAGRAPATQGLDLAAAGIALKGKKIEVSATMQTSQPHIFAAGDVCSPVDVVHIAIQQGEIAAHNAAALLKGTPPSQFMDYRLTLFGVFCSPQVAAVGATEEELKKAGIPYAAAHYTFDDHGKSMVMGETEGFVKMMAHRETGEILGASVAGPEATEIIHEMVVAMAFRATAAQFLAIPHYHPTLSEIWTYPAEELASPTTA